MEKRIKKHKGLLKEWHWLQTLQVFVPDERVKQVHFQDKTFNIREWEVNDLPIGFGFKKGGNKTVLFIGNKEEETSLSSNQLKQFILTNTHL